MVSPCTIVRNATNGAVEWSKETTSGPVIDGLQDWERDPGGAAWINGRSVHKPAVARRTELLAAWSSALERAVASRQPAPADDQAIAGELKIRAGNHCIHIEFAIQVPPDVPVRRLESWRRQCNQSLRLAGITKDWTAVLVAVPYVEPGGAAVETIVQALYHARDQLQTVLAALTDPVVCQVFLRWRGDAK